MTDTAVFALCNICDIVRGASNDLVQPLTALGDLENWLSELGAIMKTRSKRIILPLAKLRISFARLSGETIARSA